MEKKANRKLEIFIVAIILIIIPNIKRVNTFVHTKIIEANENQLDFYCYCVLGDEEKIDDYLKTNTINVNKKLNKKNARKFQEVLKESKGYFSYPIILAAENERYGVLKQLVEAGADVNLKDSFGNTALMSVANNGEENSEFELLKNAGAIINAQNSEGWTALHYAVTAQNLEMVLKLLENGADPNLNTTDNRNAIFLSRGNLEIIKLLLRFGADPLVVSDDGGTGLYTSVLFNQYDSVKLLLEKGVDPNIKYGRSQGGTSLQWACQEGYLDIVKLLLENGANPKLNDNQGRTSLWAASREGFDDIVELLLQKDVDVNYADANGSTPFMIACLRNHISTAKILLNAGANPNSQYVDGQTALFDAVKSGNNEIITLLYENGADVNIKDELGFFAMDYKSDDFLKNLIILCKS